MMKMHLFQVSKYIYKYRCIGHCSSNTNEINSVNNGSKQIELYAKFKSDQTIYFKLQ